MKITVGQLKQLIREQVEEMAGRRKKPAMSPEEVDDMWRRYNEAMTKRPAEVMKQLQAKFPKAFEVVIAKGKEKEFLKRLADAHYDAGYNGGGTLTIGTGINILRSLVGSGHDLPSNEPVTLDIGGNPIYKDDYR